MLDLIIMTMRRGRQCVFIISVYLLERNIPKRKMPLSKQLGNKHIATVGQTVGLEPRLNRPSDCPLQCHPDRSL